MVHLTITDWDNGMPAVVAAWNSDAPGHPGAADQAVRYRLHPVQQADHRQQAGTNPDISEIEYQALPEMIANKVAISLNKYLPSLSQTYSSQIMNLVNFQGSTYGVPQNICPMVFFYRKDVFAKLGLSAPTTWAQYAADAAKIHQANPKEYLGNFDAADPEWFAGPRPAGGRQLVDRPAGTPGRWRSTTPPRRRWRATGRAW